MSRFTVTPNDSMKETLDRVKQTITSKGGTFDGNTESGEFAGVTPIGKVKGKYTVNGKDIEIVITDKPFVAPMSVIEDRVRNYFA
ncbi:MAG: hypothetical protein H6996_07480 [Moraxellaceae bacterium]|nr:hypothetical protein [Pseudomonadales bacterium]MCB1673336.1 hypothetical protein [Pseudomonadales bacterium]MCP5174927.1 hypothetical protein [Moraxellaceae bacterium]MCP5176214.1 hypothetical protein [Moraxellaceae bacterium]HQV23763.1 hypothetical protein [Agitococcus sp.]